ncbi:lysostaphin resistance A-like protein, partial [Candidatus Omnitrophota bacterium]
LESDTPNAKFFGYLITIGFLVFILALILNLVFIFTGKRIDFRKLEAFKPVSWDITDIIRASIIIVFIGYVIAAAEGVILKAFHIELGLNLRMMLDTLFIDIIAVFIVFYFVVIKYKESFKSLGLSFRNFLSNILSGITAYILMLPGLLAVLLLSVWVLNLLGYTPPPQPVFEIFMEEDSSRVLFFLTIFVSFLGPIIEELFFRGFMYSAIKKRTGIIAAAFLSAAIFSALHTNITGFLPIMVLGVFLAYLYETTGSLIASMTVHIIHNSAIVTFIFFIKKLI